MVSGAKWKFMPLTPLAFFFFLGMDNISKVLAEFPLVTLLHFRELPNVKLADIIQLEGCIVSVYLHTLNV